MISLDKGCVVAVADDAAGCSSIATNDVQNQEATLYNANREGSKLLGDRQNSLKVLESQPCFRRVLPRHPVSSGRQETLRKTTLHLTRSARDIARAPLRDVKTTLEDGGDRYVIAGSQIRDLRCSFC